MAITEELATGMNVAGYPDPNTLGTIPPFTDESWLNRVGVVGSAAWIAQAKKALIPLNSASADKALPIKLALNPSGGGATTFTVTIWMFIPATNTWMKPATNSTLVSTGGGIVGYIDNPGQDPIYLQVSAISAGTLAVYYDGANARVL